jgi:hypothetical protein
MMNDYGFMGQSAGSDFFGEKRIMESVLMIFQD